MKVTSAQVVGFVTPRERSRSLSVIDKDEFLSHNPLWKRYRSLVGEKRQYQLDHLASYLSESGAVGRLNKLLTDINFLSLKLAEQSVEKLQNDYDHWNDAPNPTIDFVKQVLQLAASILEYEPTQLPEQILARITNNEVLKSLIHEASIYKQTLWLRPLSPSLAQPGGTALSTIPLDGRPSAIALTPDDQQVMVTIGGTLHCFDLKSGAAVFSCGGDTDDITDLTITQDGQYAVAATRDGTLIIWHLGLQKQLSVLPAHESAVLAVQPMAGSNVITASTDGKIKIWDISLGQEIRNRLGRIFSGYR